MTAPVFTHTPRPPKVSAEYPRQRWFLRYSQSPVTVCRVANEDKASVTAHALAGYLFADLTPAELRELARACIDAAHDIEAVPAAQGEAE